MTRRPTAPAGAGEATPAEGAEAVVERIRSIAAGWERDARLYPDARIGFAAIAYILRTALEPVDGLLGAAAPDPGPCPACSHAPHHASGACQGGSVSTITGCHCLGGQQ